MKSTPKQYPFWLFILLPAVTMLLGWGLRGFIGGGPFGAMIPGAMVMLTICMLLNVPFALAAVMAVFGTVGIGMGGDMTYGQTLGFLRNPETVWWGTCGTTVKGGVWGLVGGTFIGLGLIHRKINSKTIIGGILLFLIGLIIGLKLINDPKLIYFSDPVNNPRQESWAGLLFGAIAILTFLKIRLKSPEFRIIARFAAYGLAGGALGFGLGGFWLVLGSHFSKNTWIRDWWKLMEFSFGFIMGGFFGYAAWLTRKEIKNYVDNTLPVGFDASFIKQLAMILLVGCFIYLVLPLVRPLVEGNSNAVLHTLARVLTNFSFIGSLLILVALRWPFVAFQIAVTLTFSHTMIDLVEDLESTDLLMRGVIVLFSCIAVSFLVAAFRRTQPVLKSMFLILVWSTMAVAIVRMLIVSPIHRVVNDSYLKFIIADMLVLNIFVVSAVIVSLWIKNRLPVNAIV